MDSTETVPARTSVLLQTVKTKCQVLVQPHLVAVYEEKTDPKVKTDQIGTGFLVTNKGRPVFVTARHVLYGHAFDEDPAEKAVMVGGSLKRVGQLQSIQFVNATEHDITVFYADEFGLERCLPTSALCADKCKPPMLMIHGYLARDFKRERRTGMLRPAPWIYTNAAADMPSGYIGLRYPKSRNRNTDTGKKVMAPRPSGLSGGPMLDSMMLMKGQVSVVGVFTEKPLGQGVAVGEAISKVRSMLARM